MAYPFRSSRPVAREHILRAGCRTKSSVADPFGARTEPFSHNVGRKSGSLSTACAKRKDTWSTLQAPSCKPTQSPPQKELRKHAKGGARERKQVKRATAKVTAPCDEKGVNEGNSERQSELYGLTGRVLPLPTMPLPHDQAATECPAFQHAPNGP